MSWYFSIFHEIFLLVDSRFSLGKNVEFFSIVWRFFYFFIFDLFINSIILFLFDLFWRSSLKQSIWWRLVAVSAVPICRMSRRTIRFWQPFGKEHWGLVWHSKQNLWIHLTSEKEDSLVIIIKLIIVLI